MSFDVRVPVQRYLALDPEAHRLLQDVPLRDVSAIDLPGGGPGRTVDDVRRLVRAGRGAGGPAVRVLFGIRRVLGLVFGWDRGGHVPEGGSYVLRVPEDLRRRSRVEPGTPEGLFCLLYVLPEEMLGEVRNATVHAFACTRLEPTETGYRLYQAIYVRPVSRWTAPYMALIEPFRRWVVYPSLLRRLRAAWVRSYATPASP